MSPRIFSLRGFLSRYVVALGTALALTCAGIFAVNLGIDHKISRIHRVHRLTFQAPPPEAPAESANFLIVGSDTRAFEPTAGSQAASDAQSFGSAADVSGQRSDTIMILHVDPASRRTLLVSIPRDTWVDIPGLGMQKVNAAFNAGPQRVIDTIQQNFQVPIQHYIEVDFQTFESIVDSIGTVPVYFPAPSRDSYSGLNITAPGCYHLNGAGALAYVRARHMQQFVDGRWIDADPLSDLNRIQRQQGFIRELATLAFKKSEGSFFTANAIADDVVAKLTVDDGLSRGQILSLVNAFHNVDPANPGAFQTETIPTTAATITSGGAPLDILRVQEAQAAPMLQALRTFGQPVKLPPPPPPPPKPVRVKSPKQVHVTVVDATGGGGAAAAVSELRHEGFHVKERVAATPGPTELRYAPTGVYAAFLVGARFRSSGAFVVDRSLGGTDITLVVGTDFQGVGPPAALHAPAQIPAAAAANPAAACV